MYSIEQLEKIGGKLWEKGAMRRVYFNNLSELYGLTHQNGRSYLDGEEMSRKYASRAQMMVSEGKLWFDVPSGEFAYRGMTDDQAQKMIDRLTSQV